MFDCYLAVAYRKRIPEKNHTVCLAQSLQLCPTLLPHCIPAGSSVHGILQARILEWVPIFFSRGSSRLRDRTLVSGIIGRFFTI